MPAAAGPVTVVVLTDPNDGGVPEVLDALIPMAAHVVRVVVRVGEAAAEPSTEQTVYADHPLRCLHDVDVVGVHGDVAGTVAAAQRLTVEGDAWLWFLETDSLPGVEALPALLAVTQRSSRVGVVGPKIVSSLDPRVLVGLGHSVSLWGRSLDDLNPMEWDQGQHDGRSDVAGVPLAGMLVRADVLADVGGLEPSLTDEVAGLDVSWRVHLMGHRVVVAPEAVLSHEAGGHDRRGYGAGRVTSVRVARQRAWVALARGAGPTAIGRAMAMVATSVVAMVIMLATRRPRAFALAWAEASAVLYPWPALVARRRFAGKASVAERDLKALFLPASATRMGLRWAPATTDTWAPAPAEGMGDRATIDVTAIETGPVSDEALSMGSDTPLPRRLWSWPLAASLVVAVIATSVRWRDLGAGLAFSGWGVTSPELGAVGVDAGGIFSAWWQGWTGEGLGQSGQGASWLLPMSGIGAVFEILPGGPDADHVAGVATAWLLFAAMPVSVLTAYLALRRLVWSRPLRAILALGWASASPLTVVVYSGRVGPAVVHMVAPLIVAGVVASTQRGRHGTAAAFGVTALVGFALWWVPLMGVVAVLAAVVVAVGARGWARWRGLAIAVLPFVLLGPGLLVLVADPVRFFGGAGATAVGATPLAPWQALLLHPGGPQLAWAWWALPAWALALLGVMGLRRRRSTRIAMALSIAGLVGVAGAVILSRTSLGQLPMGYAGSGLAVTVWPGALLSMAGACVLLAAGIGATDLLPRRERLSGRMSRSRMNIVAGTALAMAATGMLGTLGLNVANGVGPSLTAARAPLPAVVAEQASGPGRVRVITLLPDDAQPNAAETFGVRYKLSATEPPRWLRDRAVDLSNQTAGTAAGSQGDPVSQAVSLLLDTSDAAVLDPTPAGLALADLAVAYIVVDAEQSHPLVTQLDQSANLIRVSSTRNSALWRVDRQVDPTRVWASDADEQRQPIALSGPARDTRGDVPQGTTDIVVSQSPDWAEQAKVTVDGELLSAAPGFPLRYELPPGGGDVVIEVPPPWSGWWWATGSLFAIVLVLCVPFVGSRPRRMAS